MQLGLKSTAIFAMFNKNNNEILHVYGLPNRSQIKIDNLISKRNLAKKKRLRKKYNTQITRLWEANYVGR